MRARLGIGVVVVVLTAGTVFFGLSVSGIGTVTGTSDAGPLADAGLDQTTTEGNTVYLDAGGSTAPDSSITGYEWEIETPTGDDIEPDCSTCAKTSFVAAEPGTYEVTVTVTDEEGRTDSDTLYVEVEPYDLPEVSVEGPSTVSVGEERTYTAEVTATEEPLSSVLWRHDGRYHAAAALDEEWSVSEEMTIRFEEPGIHEINATVADELGYQATDGMEVEVTTADPFLEVTISDIDDPVVAGDLLTVSVTVENVGDVSTTQPVVLTREQEQVGSRDTVSLAPGEEQTLEFTWETGSDDIGTHAFVAQTANDTDSREATVTGFLETAGYSICEGLSSTECLFQIGELEVEIEDLDGNLAELDLELVLPEDFQEMLDIEGVPLDPAEHDIEFISEDGEVIEVGDDGTVLLEQVSGEEGTVQLVLGEDVESDEDDILGADMGEELEALLTTPSDDDDGENHAGIEEAMEDADSVQLMPGDGSDDQEDSNSDWGAPGSEDDQQDSPGSPTGDDDGSSGDDYMDIGDVNDILGDVDGDSGDGDSSGSGGIDVDGGSGGGGGSTGGGGSGPNTAIGTF